MPALLSVSVFYFGMGIAFYYHKSTLRMFRQDHDLQLRRGKK